MAVARDGLAIAVTETVATADDDDGYKIHDIDKPALLTDLSVPYSGNLSRLKHYHAIDAAKDSDVVSC